VSGGLWVDGSQKMNCGDQGTESLSGRVLEMVIEGGKGALKRSVNSWLVSFCVTSASYVAA
jgi:hypothetical protein